MVNGNYPGYLKNEIEQIRRKEYKQDRIEIY